MTIKFYIIPFLRKFNMVRISSEMTSTFCLFLLFMGFLWLECWCGLPFPPPVDCVLSELLTMTDPSWVALPGMAHRVTELHKSLYHDKVVIHEEAWMIIVLLYKTLLN